MRPSGLLSWRYLSPSALRDPRVRAHRSLWLAGRGRLALGLWLPLELVRWLVWQLVRGPALARRFFSAEPEEDVSPEERRRLLWLVRAWCLPPYEIKRHDLHRRPGAELDIVYDVETTAFHALMNGRSRAACADVRVLRDKVATARRLGAAKIPVAPVLACIGRGDGSGPPAYISAGSPVFCKSRHGQGGRLAFAAWRGSAGLQGRTFEGAVLRTEPEVEQAWRRLVRSDDALIQPLLSNDPAIAPLADGGELITLRYISRRTADGYVGYCAVLEVPVRRETCGGNAYALIPLASADGTLLPWPESAADASQAQSQTARARSRAPGLLRPPHWDVIRANSHLAHRQVPHLWAVAWDWAITPSGPLLLEGNSGWSLAVPQLLGLGGLVDQALEASAASQRLSQ